MNSEVARVRSRLSSGLLGDALQYVSERFVRLGLAAISGVVVARYLGPADLGLLSFVSAIFALLIPIASLGLHQVLVREFSAASHWQPVLASALVRQMTAALCASLIGVAIVVSARGDDHDAVLLAILMAPAPLLSLEQSVRAYLQAAGQVRRVVIAGLAGAIVATTMKLTGVAAGAPLWVFGAVGTVEGSLVLLGLVTALPNRPSIAALWRNYDAARGRRLVAEGAPLLGASLAVAVYMKADLLMLGAMKGDAETGLYASAARLSEVWYFIPTAAAAAVWPQLARLHADGETHQYNQLIQRFMTGLSGVSLGAVVAVAVSAEVIVQLLYGTEFAGAANVLRVHIVASPFVFLGVAGSQWFIDRGLTRSLLLRSVIGAFVNVAANLILIPPLGAVGAALATLTAYALSGVLLNGVFAETRPLFFMQLRALRMSRLRKSTENRAETRRK